MNAFGLYTLKELREMVRRRSDMFRRTVDTSTGAESDPVIINPLISNEDLNMHINYALTKRHVDTMLEDETVFSDDEVIDVYKDTVEYQLPTDMALLRKVYWKDPQVVYTVVPPVRRLEMYQVEDDDPRLDYNGVPTYKRRLNFIVLNETPRVNNPQGILVQYIKWILPLMHDAAIIESQFARVLQEVVIWDSAIDVVSNRFKVDTSEMQAMLKPLEERYTMLVRNASMPPNVRIQLREHPIKARGCY